MVAGVGPLRQARDIEPGAPLLLRLCLARGGVAPAVRVRLIPEDAARVLAGGGVARAKLKGSLARPTVRVRYALAI